MTDDGFRAQHDAGIRGLDCVLDVEAGLAEVLRAGKTMDEGLERLFRRLGPPTADRDDEK